MNKLIKILIWTTITILSFAMCNTRENPFMKEWNTPYGLPPFSEIKYEDYIPAIKKGIEIKKKEFENIINNEEEPNFENTITAFELSGEMLSKVTGVLYNLSSSDNSPEFEKIMEEAIPMLTEADNDFFMNKKFFERVSEIYLSGKSNYTKEQMMLMKHYYTKFLLNGVNLDDDAGARFKEINKELSSAQQKFGNNLLAENNAFKQTFGIPVSGYTEFMASEKDRNLREKMFKAYSNRGNNGNANDNNDLSINILKLRAEKAELLGFKNFAEYELSDKMAQKPEIVDEFLAGIFTSAVKKAKKEIADMQKLMDEDIASGELPAGSKIMPWDWFYYAEKVKRQKFDLDESLTKPYFELNNVRNGVFAIAEKIYGIKVTPLKKDYDSYGKEADIPIYHPEVEAFKVTDADGSLLGIFYTDFLPRSGKNSGAWMSNFRDQYYNAKGEDVRPVIVNVCSLNPPSDSLPSLLTISQVETVFHEFGHALHGLLSKCHYKSVSGTSVSRDFVETFSQFNENWAFLPDMLKMYAKHYKTGEMIPDSLIAKINDSGKFNQGFMTTELCAASILDMKLHELSSEDLKDAKIADLEKSICEKMGLIPEIIPRYKSTYFAHIFSGDYCAGYYGYLWSEVLDKDAFSYFRQNGVYDKKTADRFRKTFLEKGGSDEPMDLYVSFMGRKPSIDALLEARDLK